LKKILITVELDIHLDVLVRPIVAWAYWLT